MASDEEKLAIVQHFLLNAPPGVFDEVKSDALALVSESVVRPDTKTPYLECNAAGGGGCGDCVDSAAA